MCQSFPFRRLTLYCPHTRQGNEWDKIFSTSIPGDGWNLVTGYSAISFPPGTCSWKVTTVPSQSVQKCPPCFLLCTQQISNSIVGTVSGGVWISLQLIRQSMKWIGPIFYWNGQILPKQCLVTRFNVFYWSTEKIPESKGKSWVTNEAEFFII